MVSSPRRGGVWGDPIGPSAGLRRGAANYGREDCAAANNQPRPGPDFVSESGMRINHFLQHSSGATRPSLCGYIANAHSDRPPASVPHDPAASAHATPVILVGPFRHEITRFFARPENELCLVLQRVSTWISQRSISRLAFRPRCHSPDKANRV